MSRSGLIAGVLLLPTIGILAQPRTVGVVIDRMDCPTCPVTIKKALMKDPGVSRVAVHYDQKRLDVSFDDAKTSVEAILKTTAGIGFPARVLQ